MTEFWTGGTIQGIRVGCTSKLRVKLVEIIAKFAVTDRRVATIACSGTAIAGGGDTVFIVGGAVAHNTTGAFAVVNA